MLKIKIDYELLFDFCKLPMDQRHHLQPPQRQQQFLPPQRQQSPHPSIHATIAEAQNMMLDAGVALILSGGLVVITVENLIAEFAIAVPLEQNLNQIHTFTALKFQMLQRQRQHQLPQLQLQLQRRRQQQPQQVHILNVYFKEIFIPIIIFLS